jgi:hypothetical protein
MTVDPERPVTKHTQKPGKLFAKFPTGLSGSGKKNILLRQTRIYGLQGVAARRQGAPRTGCPSLKTINPGLPEQNILFAGTLH